MKKNCQKAGDFAAETAEVPLAQETELCPNVYPNKLAYITTALISGGTS